MMGQRVRARQSCLSNTPTLMVRDPLRAILYPSQGSSSCQPLRPHLSTVFCWELSFQERNVGDHLTNQSNEQPLLSIKDSTQKGVAVCSLSMVPNSDNIVCIFISFHFYILDDASYIPVWFQMLYINKDDLKLSFLLFAFPKTWNWGFMPPHPVFVELDMELRALWMLDKHSINWVLPTEIHPVFWII